VQVDPIKSMLKAPGTKRLKLKHDEVLPNFCFQIQLVTLHRGCRGRVAGMGLHSSTLQLNLSPFIIDRLTLPSVSNKKCLP